METLKLKISKNKAITDAERRKLDSEAHEHFIKHGNRNHGGSSENKPSEDRTQVLISPLHPHHRALDAGAHPPSCTCSYPRRARTARSAAPAARASSSTVSSKRWQGYSSIEHSGSVVAS